MYIGIYLRTFQVGKKQLPPAELADTVGIFYTTFLSRLAFFFLQGKLYIPVFVVKSQNIKKTEYILRSYHASDPCRHIQQT